MSGKRLVFNQPILQKIVEKFKYSINNQLMRQEALIDYEIDEYDERFLRHFGFGLHQGTDYKSAWYAFRRKEFGKTAERTRAETIRRRP